MEDTQARLKERGENMFFSLCAVIIIASGMLLFFLSYSRKEIFSAIDPSVFVWPFLCYTLSILCAGLAMAFIPLYIHCRSFEPADSAYSPRFPLCRLWLYPAASFCCLAILLFIAATGLLAYLIIL